MASLSCSGVVVRLGQNPDVRAVLLSNGHCYKKLRPNIVVVNQAHQQSVSLLSRDGRSRNFSTTRLLYAATTGADLALMELAVTYRELAQAGIDSYEIDPEPAAPNEPIDMISGYTRTAQRCSVESIVPRLLEFPWEWRDSYRLAGCRGEQQGLSGSPLISPATQRVVGIFNTTNDNGMQCTLNNPCEVDLDGNIFVQQGAPYGQRVDQILTCLDSQSRFDTTVASCLLFLQPQPGEIRNLRCGNLIPVGDPCAKGISETTYDQILDRVEDVYQPIVKKSHGAKLKVRHLWTHPAVDASSRGGDPRSWSITLYGGFARHPNMTAEAFALAACHEIGHLLGGFPRNYDASSEGAADYFATLKCLRRVMPSDQPLREVDPAVRQACAGVFPEGSRRNQCEIGSMAGLAFAVFMQETDNVPRRPSFTTPDTSLTSQAYRTPPTAQCRLDTFFQGALCAKDVDEPLSDAGPGPGACTSEEGFTVGLRPACWFAPPLPSPARALGDRLKSLPGALSGRGL